MSDRPLRILELRTVRGTGGGPEKTILLGTARTDRAKYEVTVCYVRDGRDPVFHIDRRAQALPIDYVEVRERRSLDHRIWRELKSLVRSRRIDIVHAHDYKTDLLAWLLGRRTAAIPIATAHGWTGHSARERYLYYPGDRWVLARLRHVIAVSSDIKRRLVRAGTNASRVTVVLNAIDPGAFARHRALEREARSRLGFDGRHFVLGAVGRLEPQKNFSGLIEAFGAVHRCHPQARLVIAGDGSLRTLLQEEVQARGLGAVCTLAGHVSDVRGFHHALDLFVQSSDYEGTPNAVLEAMALETPIVATDAGGTSEVARDGLDAVIVPCRDTSALSQAVRRVLADPTAACARAARAKRRVETELSFETRMRKVESIYDRVAGRDGVAAPRDPASCAIF